MCRGYFFMEDEDLNLLFSNKNWLEIICNKVIYVAWTGILILMTKSLLYTLKL